MDGNYITALIFKLQYSNFVLDDSHESIKIQ